MGEQGGACDLRLRSEKPFELRAGGLFLLEASARGEVRVEVVLLFEGGAKERQTVSLTPKRVRQAVRGPAGRLETIQLLFPAERPRITLHRLELVGSQ